jgi:hypothetical protein
VLNSEHLAEWLESDRAVAYLGNIVILIDIMAFALTTDITQSRGATQNYDHSQLYIHTIMLCLAFFYQWNPPQIGGKRFFSLINTFVYL